MFSDPGEAAILGAIAGRVSNLKSETVELMTTGELTSKFYQGARNAAQVPDVINSNANRCTSDIFHLKVNDVAKITGLTSGQKYAIAGAYDAGSTYDSGWETYTTRYFTAANPGKFFLNIATSAGNTPISPSDLGDLKVEIIRADLEWLNQPNWDLIDSRFDVDEGYVDYGYKPFHVTYYGSPDSGATRSWSLYVEQRNTFVKLSHAEVTQTLAVKINNGIKKTGTGSVKNLTGGTKLTADHVYEISIRHISGTVSHYPTLSVYRKGESATVGAAEYIDAGKTFKRTFTAEYDVEYMFCVYLNNTFTATDAVFQVLLRDITAARGIFGSEIDTTVAAVRELQTEPCIVFPLVTDIHYGVSEDGDNYMFKHLTIENLRAVLSQIRADFTVNLGDVTNGDSANTEEYAATVNNLFRSLDVPYILAIGNHDDNRYRSGYTFDDEKMYAYYTAFNDNTVVFNENTNGRDYYIDIANYNVRFVVLDSNTDGDYGFNDATVTWFENVALDTAADCQVVVFVHESPIASQNYNNSSLDNGGDIADAIEAYQTGGKSIIQLYGHSHADVAFTSPYLSIGSNCNKFENTNGDPNLWPEGATKPSRVWGAVSEDCWDMVVLRPLSKKIDFVRFGAGNDRSYTYT